VLPDFSGTSWRRSRPLGHSALKNKNRNGRDNSHLPPMLHSYAFNRTVHCKSGKSVFKRMLGAFLFREMQSKHPERNQINVCVELNSSLGLS
jgi:hypothetical protein